MILKIGVCDDSEKARQAVLRWLKSRPDVMDKNVYCFTCGAALLEHLRLSTLDIIFLDCKMEGMDGIETAKRIREHDSRTTIIMLTDFTDYAVYGYRTEVFEYILKSEFHTRVGSVFDKAVKRIEDNSAKTYAVKTGTGLYHLNINEILFIESHGRKKELFLRNGERHEFYGKIDEIESDLKKHGFIRPHNSYLVNSNYVRVFMPDGIHLMSYDLPIPVSRGRYKKAYDDMTVFATEVRQ
jgi:DNA-binding LytR/AlgR family response regulator